MISDTSRAGGCLRIASEEIVETPGAWRVCWRAVTTMELCEFSSVDNGLSLEVLAAVSSDAGELTVTSDEAAEAGAQ